MSLSQLFPPRCVPSIQSYLFIPLCSSRDHSFFHPLPALSEQRGRLLGRIRTGQRPAQLAQGWLDTPLPPGDKDPPHAPEAGIPGHRTAPLWCSSSVPPEKASAPRMPQSPLGQQHTHGWRRRRQRMSSARSRDGSWPIPTALLLKHCLHLLRPAAFPALLQHPHPIAQGTQHGLPGPWAPLKPSPGRAPALCFPLTHPPVIHPLLLPDSPISATAMCMHPRVCVRTRAQPCHSHQGNATNSARQQTGQGARPGCAKALVSHSTQQQEGQR